jgi:hypothetical protein
MTRFDDPIKTSASAANPRSSSRGAGREPFSSDSVVVGKSARMRGVFDFVRVIASSESTVLITGASGPQPHPSFIDFLCEAAVGDRYREMAGAGEDWKNASDVTGT